MQANKTAAAFTWTALALPARAGQWLILIAAAKAGAL
jgi:hypothetical protein